MPPNVAPHAARERMRANRFDIMPLGEPGTAPILYARTERWNNYESVRFQQIDSEDLVSYRVSVIDLIRLLADRNRAFYFLEDIGEVVGLVTISHLNARPTKIAIYAMLIELEAAMANLIVADGATDDEISSLTLASPRGRSQNDWPSSDYYRDRQAGVETRIVDYLYLTDLVEILAERNLVEVLGYASSAEFEKAMKSINRLRRLVAHPNRSLIHSPDGVRPLWNDLKSIKYMVDLCETRQL
ncbi:MAG: hypothetical protein IT340_00480 [Chloroflexi bacterium]|nr:hypothetical protein [Chloroflexota bacterium]